MHPTLQQLEVELAASITGLSVAQTQATPPAEPEKWCVQQIVEHLLLTYRATIAAFDKRIERGSSNLPGPDLRQRLGQFYITTLGRFPAGRTAPPSVCPILPSTLRDGDELISVAQADLGALDRTVARAEQIFGSHAQVSHQVLGPMAIDSWRRFHLIHGRHHIRQIRAIRGASDL